MLQRFQGWYNLLSALGSSTLDRVVNHVFAAAPRLPPELAEQLYYGDDFAATMCDALPTDALRKGFALRITGDAELASQAQAELRRLKAQEKIKQAAIWGRCMGGAAIIMVCDDDQDMQQPLRIGSLSEVRFLEVATRRDLVTETRYGERVSVAGRVVDLFTGRTRQDPQERRAQELHDQPETFRWTQSNGRQTVVHETRMLLFGGDPCTSQERRANQDWDRSVLDRVYPVLQQVNHTWQSVVANVDVSAQAVMGIKGLTSGIESGSKDVLSERLELTQQARGMRILPIDAEDESFEYAERSLTGLTDVALQNWQRLAAASRMPVTRLMGMSPAGLNATGEADDANWDDHVEAYQTDELRPVLEALLAVVFAAKLGPFRGVAPETCTVEFAPLKQPSALERAQERQAQASVDEAEVRMGAVTAAEIAASRHRPEGWSAETKLDEAARKKAQTEQSPTAALNGAQVTAIVEVVKAVASGELPRDAGVAIVAAATGQTADVAELLIGSAGTDEFVPASVAAAQAQADQSASEKAQEPDKDEPEQGEDEPEVDDAAAARAAKLAERLRAKRAA